MVKITDIQHMSFLRYVTNGHRAHIHIYGRNSTKYNRTLNQRYKPGTCKSIQNIHHNLVGVGISVPT